MFSKVINSKDTKDFTMNFIMFFIVTIVFSLILKFLWNRTLVPHITILKPVTDVVDAFWLSLGLMILR